MTMTVDVGILYLDKQDVSMKVLKAALKAAGEVFLRVRLLILLPTLLSFRCHRT